MKKNKSTKRTRSPASQTQTQAILFDANLLDTRVDDGPPVVMVSSDDEPTPKRARRESTTIVNYEEQCSEDFSDPSESSDESDVDAEDMHMQMIPELSSTSVDDGEGEPSDEDDAGKII